MTLNIYLDYLDPPGSLALGWNPAPDEKEPPDVEKAMAIFVGMGLRAAGDHLMGQLARAGRIKTGHASAQKHVEAWLKTARPVAHVMLLDGFYSLMYPQGAPQHPLPQQAWRYIHKALDVVSGDFKKDGTMLRNSGHAQDYADALPLRLLAHFVKLPPLDFSFEEAAE